MKTGGDTKTTIREVLTYEQIQNAFDDKPYLSENHFYNEKYFYNLLNNFYIDLDFNNQIRLLKHINNYFKDHEYFNLYQEFINHLEVYHNLDNKDKNLYNYLTHDEDSRLYFFLKKAYYKNFE